jgi:adenylate kinase
MGGSGKSTQAHLLSLAYGFPRISAGDQLRELAKQEESPLREQAESLMLKGALMPDELLISVAIAPLQATYHTSRGFILDGVPRNPTQANIVATSLGELGMYTIKAIHIHVSLEQVHKRIAQRLVCENCQAPSGYPGSQTRCDFCDSVLISRNDDMSNIIVERWQEHFRQTGPLIQNYEREGKLIQINGDRSIHIVFAEIINALRLAGL